MLQRNVRQKVMRPSKFFLLPQDGRGTRTLGVVKLPQSTASMNVAKRLREIARVRIATGLIEEGISLLLKVHSTLECFEGRGTSFVESALEISAAYGALDEYILACSTADAASDAARALIVGDSQNVSPDLKSLFLLCTHKTAQLRLDWMVHIKSSYNRLLKVTEAIGIYSKAIRWMDYAKLNDGVEYILLLRYLAEALKHRPITDTQSQDEIDEVYCRIVVVSEKYPHEAELAKKRLRKLRSLRRWNKAAMKIQALWKGHRVRCLPNDQPEHVFNSVPRIGGAAKSAAVLPAP